MEKYLTRNFDNPDARTLEGYEKSGGYASARKALRMKPEDIIAAVKDSNLRGRGGAGFPAGVKWGFLPKSDRPRYLVVNADEGEPGTFKDRQLMERDPHRLLEGIVITTYAIGAHVAYIYIRGELVQAARLLEKAIAEARSRGYIGASCFDAGHALDVVVHRGAGAYICGEETALLNSLEGRRGEPRLKPPFPALVGAFSDPTIINNVETICAVPQVIEMGSGAYAGLGVPGEGGTRIFCVSGHVKKPGLYELPVGTNLKKIIFEEAGGVRGDMALKAVFPGGSSTPILPADDIDHGSSIKEIQAAGSMIGSAAVVVMDETTCMVRVAWRLTRFYRHESCGQCTPCRLGTRHMLAILDDICAGRGREGDLELLQAIGGAMQKGSFCPLGQTAPNPVLSTIRHFRDEYEEHIRDRTCGAASRRGALSVMHCDLKS